MLLKVWGRSPGAVETRGGAGKASIGGPPKRTVSLRISLTGRRGRKGGKELGKSRGVQKSQIP